MQTTFNPLLIATLTAVMTLTGCSSLKNLTGKKSDVITHASNSEQGYYQEAQDAIAKERYNAATIALNNIRTFYPTGQYAQQALLDLIYVHYQARDFEAVTTATSQFLQSYPSSPHADYALYAQGVTHMQGSPKAGRLFSLNQGERDTAYLRLAFADFSNLLARYPNSPYAGDVALRMTDIYNQFAHHELTAAYWYVKREAYVAAANRASWVFQYYPQSTSIPEAIAILAYSNEKLGITNTANQYKTLLQINYPNYLDQDGSVRLPKANIGLWQKTLNAVSFGKLGRVGSISTDGASTYQGATRTQTIQNAQALRLPQTTANQSLPEPTANRTRPVIGLGLPDLDSEAGNQNSSQSTAIDNIHMSH